MTQTIRIAGAFAIVAVFGGAFAVSRIWQRDASTETAYATEIHASRRPATPEELVAGLKMRDRLRALRVLSKTNPKGATLKLLPLLRDPAEQVRVEAVREVGRLEQPSAERPLSQMLAELEDARRAVKQGNIVSVRVPPENVLRVALARVRTQQLKGQARLEAVAQSLGLTLDDLVAMSKRVNGPERSWLDDTSDETIVQEVVSLLYDMVKHGEDVSALTARFKLNPQQQIMLKGATLPTTQEAYFLVNYITRYRGALTGDMHQLAEQHLLSLGSAADVALIRYLNQVKAHPEQYRRTSVLSFGLLLRAAADTGDSRVLPLLKHFEKVPEPWPQVAAEAREARQLIENDQRLLRDHAERQD